MTDTPMIKFSGGATLPLDVLPADLRRRWDQAQSGLANAHTASQSTLARVELNKIAKDIAITHAASFVLKKSPRRSILGLGLSGG